MSKTYDSGVAFPSPDLHLIGFPQNFIDLTEACVCTSRIRLNINSEVDEFLRLEKGLRQDDPLSSYLFIICSEILSTLLCEGESHDVFKSVKINTRAHWSHTSYSFMTYDN